MLVDTRFMCKGIGTNDRLSRRNRYTGNRLNQAARAIDLRGINIAVYIIIVMPYTQCHNTFFHRSVTSTFADTIDGHLNLRRARRNRGQRIRSSHAQVIVAVSAQSNVLNSRNPLAHSPAQLGVLARHCITNGIGEVNSLCTSLDSSFTDATEKIPIAASGVLCGKLKAAFIAIFLYTPRRWPSIRSLGCANILLQ